MTLQWLSSPTNEHPLVLEKWLHTTSYDICMLGWSDWEICECEAQSGHQQGQEGATWATEFYRLWVCTAVTATCRHLWAPWRRAIFLNLARSTEVVSATLFRARASTCESYTILYTYGSYGPSPKSGVTYFFVESVESLRMSLLGAVATGAESQKAYKTY